MRQFGDPARCVYGPRQVADIEATVKESGAPLAFAAAALAMSAAAAAAQPVPVCPARLLFAPRAVAAGRPWQVMITQVVMGRLNAPRLAETAHLQPKLLAWLCK